MSAPRRSTRISLRSEPSDVEMAEASPKRRTSSPKKKPPTDQRPPHIESAKHEIVGEDFIQNTYDGYLNRRDYQKYLDRIEIKIVNDDTENATIEFDLLNVEAPIANTIRRIMIAEVPTMAIDKVCLYQNDTVFQDEVLCHRLGLIPIRADARNFNFRTKLAVEPDEYTEPETKETENLVFDINVKCKKKKVVPADAKDKNDHFENSIVRSGDFVWEPIGDQATTFKKNPPSMVHDDIVILKMRHGQEIEAKCICYKGIGRDHAKFSPVGTASYRLLPEIVLNRPIHGEPAERLQKAFSKGVIEIDSDGFANVVDSRADTLSRNVFRYDDLKDAVEIRRKKNHFIFSVESVGQYEPGDIVTEACGVMVAKVSGFREALKKLIAS
uniref:DNA-directed RNA polymerases I and III subunit RPAC1 n=1 Tax=Panagrellus redivivus TaxID=6233 RepID=A0A7E4VG70_PANRE